VAGLGSANVRQLHFYIAEEGTTAAAYVILTVVGQAWTLEECGDRTIASTAPSTETIAVRILGSHATAAPLCADDVLFWRNDLL
jgi:hypothetical protein